MNHYCKIKEIIKHDGKHRARKTMNPGSNLWNATD